MPNMIGISYQSAQLSRLNLAAQMTPCDEEGLRHHSVVYSLTFCLKKKNRVYRSAQVSVMNMIMACTVHNLCSYGGMETIWLLAPVWQAV